VIYSPAIEAESEIGPNRGLLLFLRAMPAGPQIGVKNGLPGTPYEKPVLPGAIPGPSCGGGTPQCPFVVN